MTQQTEALEEEVEDLLEHNLCLQDDVKQLQAELAEANHGIGQVAESLAEFLYLTERTDVRAIQDLIRRVNDAGYRYEVDEQADDGSFNSYYRQRYQKRFRLIQVPREQDWQGPLYLPNGPIKRI